MAKLVECVPNFSEGRDLKKIKLITDAIEEVEGVKLLDVDPGKATNRTVVTIAGEPEIVLEAAFRGIKKASEIIDMRNHKGEHSRMGATDVCPFIPISGIDFDECIELSKKLGERVGRELNIPVYLYGFSASKPERVRLPDIRKGEYEGLEEKFKDPEWKPDFGKAEFNAKSGATAIGVRKFLIAYNVNLNTARTAIAKEIGLEIRETGRIQKDENGKGLRGDDGKFLRNPGLLKNVQATGWFIEEYKRAQVTINIMDHIETPLHIVYETVREQAEKLGARVTGSELVGLIPKDALIEAGLYFLKKQGTSVALSEMDILRTAVISMGLDELNPFEIEQKVIDYRFTKKGLKDLKITEFCDELASDSPAPGGGSVAALLGALGASLAAMVTNLTYYKKDYEENKDLLEKVGASGQNLKKSLLQAIDDDTEAYNKMVESRKLPKKTEDDKKTRNKAIQESNKYAMEIPFNTMKNSLEVLKLAYEVAYKGNPNCLSDAGVAALCAEAAITGAYYNVKINASSVEDLNYIENILAECDNLLNEKDRISAKIKEKMNTL
ncbi:MAG: glutamate formimidoyltransferase [Candidatus Muirbacterium halophilum]|nr:glutamate formimidoyltransferase [Candidatus Muirbacterium halophilum]MCK9475911.1 glutamate formimidoyltransferase [Candidatus Muirbacterium halophilum]